MAFNRYAYVGYSSISHSDPSGHMEYPGDGGGYVPIVYRPPSPAPVTLPPSSVVDYPVLEPPGYIYDPYQQMCWGSGNNWFPPFHYEIPMIIGFEQTYSNLPNHDSDQVSANPLNDIVSLQLLDRNSAALLLMGQGMDFLLRFPIRKPNNDIQGNLHWGFDVTYHLDLTMTVDNFFVNTSYPDVVFSRITVGSTDIYGPIKLNSAILPPGGSSIIIDQTIRTLAIAQDATILIKCRNCGPGGKSFPFLATTQIPGLFTLLP